MKRLLCLAIGLPLVAPAAPAAAAAFTFTTLDVSGAVATFPTGINDAGQVIGNYTDAAGQNHGFLDTAGAITTFDPTGSVGTYPTGINASGQITGAYTDTAGIDHGFVDTAGAFRTVDVAGSPGTEPIGIDAAGNVVGYYFNSSQDLSAGQVHAFDTVANIPPYLARFPLLLSVWSAVVGVNAAGEFTGLTSRTLFNNTFNPTSGFVGQGTQGFTFAVSGFAFTAGASINASRQVTGSYGNNDGIVHGFLYNAPAGVFAGIDRGDLAVSVTTIDPVGSSYTNPTGINDPGQITGYYVDNVTQHGFFYDAGAMTVLDPAGSSFTQPVGINSAGDITGYYIDAHNKSHGFIAILAADIAVPEASSIALLSTALTALWFLRRRRSVLGYIRS